MANLKYYNFGTIENNIQVNISAPIIDDDGIEYFKLSIEDISSMDISMLFELPSENIIKDANNDKQDISHILSYVHNTKEILMKFLIF